MSKGMTVAQKLGVLKALLQIANQVLQLNTLKHKLIIDNVAGQQKSISSSSNSQDYFFTNAIQSSSGNHHGQSYSQVPVGPLFIKDKERSQTSSVTRAKASPQQQDNASLSPTRQQVAAAQTQDIYYQRKLSNAASATQKDATTIGSTRVEDQYSTLVSSKGFSPQTNGQLHRRNRSDGQVSQTDNSTPRSTMNHQGHQAVVPLPHYHRWTSEKDESYLAQQAADNYFSTTSTSPGGCPGLPRSSGKQELLNGLINIEKVPMTHQHSQSFVTGKTLGGGSIGDRVTWDSSKQQAAILHASKRSGRDESFGVASSSTGSASRNMHQPQNEMQMSSTVKTSHMSPAGLAKTSTITSKKDASESNMTTLTNSRQKMSNNILSSETRRERTDSDASWVTGKTQQVFDAKGLQYQHNNADKQVYSWPKQLPRNNIVASQQQELACATVELDSQDMIKQRSNESANRKVNMIPPQYDSQVKKIADFLHESQELIQSPILKQSIITPDIRRAQTMKKKGSMVASSPKVEPDLALSPRASAKHLRTIGQAIKEEALKRGLTIKANTTVARNQSATFSDMDCVSQSQNTLDQFEVASNRGKITDKSSSAHKVNKNIRNSNTKRKKKATTTTAHSSYLASINCSTSQNETVTVSNIKQYCGGMPESKVKKALKGVIQAQKDSFSNTMSHSQSQRYIGGVNSNQLSSTQVLSQTKASKGGLQQQREHLLKKSSSARFVNMPQSNSTQVVKAAAAGQSPTLKKTLVRSPTGTLSPSGQRPQNSSRTDAAFSTAQAQVISPQVSMNKKMQVLTGGKQSNFILRQSISVNTDKIAMPASQTHQKINAEGQRKNKSPQSLTQAFSAVAKAISKRTPKTSAQPSSVFSSKKTSAAALSNL